MKRIGVTLILLVLGQTGALAQKAQPDPFGPSTLDRKPLSLEQFLENVILPTVEFDETPFPDALEFLRFRGDELERTFNVVNILPDSDEIRITLKLKDIPIGEAIRYTASLAQGKMVVGEHAIEIVPEDGVGVSQPRGKVADPNEMQKKSMGSHYRHWSSQKLRSWTRCIFSSRDRSSWM